MKSGAKLLSFLETVEEGKSTQKCIGTAKSNVAKH